MRNTLKWCSILLLGLVLVLASSVAGCENIDSETYNYLSKMQVWHEKWDKYEWELLKAFSDPAYDLLLDELAAIESPRELIPRRKGNSGEMIYPPRDHEEYLDAHRLYLIAQRHMETIQEIEEARFRARGDDHIPACDIAQYIDVSQEYREACGIKYQALRHLVKVRYKWDSVFREYFPERYEKE